MAPVLEVRFQRRPNRFDTFDPESNLVLSLKDDVDVALEGGGARVGRPLDLDVAEREEGVDEHVFGHVPGHTSEEDLGAQRRADVRTTRQLAGPDAGSRGLDVYE